MSFYLVELKQQVVFLALQWGKRRVRLLRLIQTGRFSPLGSSEEREVDVQIVAAANQEHGLIAHRSGDPARNLWLSEQRAKAVRGYLLARGISAERLLVNYYGDSRSLGREPGDRRVEVEWLR